MIHFLAKKYIPDYQNYENEQVRYRYGNLTSFVGIINNIILFIIKLISGLIMNSVSIRADAINNLSDAGSSIIALISFKLSKLPADQKHPFGHARFECIASMIVACFIFFLGFDLVKTSIHKIFHPEVLIFSWFSFIILLLSILIKLWMYQYNKKYGSLVNSSIMEATATDSLSDALSTAAVLVSMIISRMTGFNLDGYVGIVVAIIILYAGYGIIVNALDEILGKAPSVELVHELRAKIKSYPGVLGIHDLMIHDYGAHNTFASVHVEVDCDVDINTSHDVIDNIERDVKEDMGLELVIHMDPINIHDEETNKMKNITNIMLKAYDSKLSLHDFRVVPGETHTNLIFDVVIPFSATYTNEEILDYLSEQLGTFDHKYYLVVTFDRAYTTQYREEETN